MGRQGRISRDDAGSPPGAPPDGALAWSPNGPACGGASPSGGRASWLLSRALLAGALALGLGCGACNRCGAEEGAAETDDATMTSPFDPDRPEDPLAPPPERTPLGAWVDAEDYRVRVVAVEDCEVEPYFAPRPGHRKIGVHLELTGLRDEPVPVNGLFATLLDSTGEPHRPTPAGCRPTLPAGRLEVGQTTRGFVSFEVAEDASGLLLRYQPIIVGRVPRPITFDLGR